MLSKTKEKRKGMSAITRRIILASAFIATCTAWFIHHQWMLEDERKEQAVIAKTRRAEAYNRYRLDVEYYDDRIHDIDREIDFAKMDLENFNSALVKIEACRKIDLLRQEKRALQDKLHEIKTKYKREHN